MVLLFCCVCRFLGTSSAADYTGMALEDIAQLKIFIEAKRKPRIKQQNVARQLNYIRNLFYLLEVSVRWFQALRAGKLSTETGATGASTQVEQKLLAFAAKRKNFQHKLAMERAESARSLLPEQEEAAGGAEEGEDTAEGVEEDEEDEEGEDYIVLFPEHIESMQDPVRDVREVKSVEPVV